jgi:hypothetical protein
MTDTNTPTPENIIPITPEEAPEAPLASSANEQSQQPASDATEIPAVEQTEEDPVQAVIKGVDLNTLTKDDVFTDIIHQSKLFAFRLMVGAALLEQLIVKNHKEEEEAAAAGKAE